MIWRTEGSRSKGCDRNRGLSVNLHRSDWIAANTKSRLGKSMLPTKWTSANSFTFMPNNIVSPGVWFIISWSWIGEMSVSILPFASMQRKILIPPFSIVQIGTTVLGEIRVSHDDKVNAFIMILNDPRLTSKTNLSYKGINQHNILRDRNDVHGPTQMDADMGQIHRSIQPTNIWDISWVTGLCNNCANAHWAGLRHQLG